MGLIAIFHQYIPNAEVMCHHITSAFISDVPEGLEQSLDKVHVQAKHSSEIWMIEVARLLFLGGIWCAYTMLVAQDELYNLMA